MPQACKNTTKEVVCTVLVYQVEGEKTARRQGSVLATKVRARSAQKQSGKEPQAGHSRQQDEGKGTYTRHAHIHPSSTSHCVAPFALLVGSLPHENDMTVAAESSNPFAASSLPVTAIIFAVISVVLYMWLLKPLLPPGDTPQRQVAQSDREPARVVQRPRGRQPSRMGDASDISTLLQENTRLPPHMAPTGAQYLDTGGISLLSEGLLPFRYGRAAAYEQAVDSDRGATNRKDRARVLSRVLSLDGSSGSPPSRGSTVVICIPSTDVGCEKLRRALYLLSTHFNTLLILSVAPGTTDNDIDDLVAKLRGDDPTSLPCDVLPRHRIVGAQSMTGRIAFVRQLGSVRELGSMRQMGRVEFVLDYDEDMRSQLGRFGFRVLIYGGSLGNALLA